jgi:hypothetical protein
MAIAAPAVERRRKKYISLRLHVYLCGHCGVLAFDGDMLGYISADDEPNLEHLLLDPNQLSGIRLVHKPSDLCLFSNQLMSSQVCHIIPHTLRYTVCH